MKQAVLVLACTIAGWSQSKNPDTWERQKECLKAAEADIARQPKVGGEIVNWSAHYSVKYGHCYVKVDRIFVSKAPDPKDNKVFLSGILRDALENTIVAAASSSVNLPDTEVRACYTPSNRKASCDEAEAFIEDHMKN